MDSDNTIHITSIKEGCEKCACFKKGIDNIRDERNKILASTDYLMIQDIFSKYDIERQEQIKEYRQNLRDIMDDIMDDKITFNINLSPEEIINEIIPSLNTTQKTNILLINI
jgi:hypothetical protein